MTIAAVFRVTHNGRDITGRDDERPENVPIRAWRTIMKSGYVKAGVYWVENYRALRFSKAARFRYPKVYKRRSQAYFRRHLIDKTLPHDQQSDAAKAAEAKHRPLVFTGTLEAFTRQATVKAFQTRVSIQIPVPNYVTKRVRGGRVDMWAELTAVNTEEQNKLTAIVSEQVDRATENFLKTRTLPSLQG
ncbi:MAG: hypothetical protein ABJZ55_20430 [Fuerstiella sp.]